MSLILSEVKALAHEEKGYIGKKLKTDNLDVKEAPNGKGLYNKYARDVYEAGFFNANKQGQNYCTSYAHWLMLKCCGSKEECEKHFPITSLGASTYYCWNWFNKNGKAGTEPKPGAFVFFSSDGTCVYGKMNHTGVVLDVKDGVVYTTEGNVSYVVKEKSYDIGNAKIAAYGYVDYDPEPEPDVKVSKEEWDRTQKLLAEYGNRAAVAEEKVGLLELSLDKCKTALEEVLSILKE